MDHDTGFAPRIVNDRFCFLSGCKTTTAEVWAREGSWIIGIGGNDTHKPNKLIYAMKVDRNVSIKDFRKEFPREKKHLFNNKATNALVSTEFYYLGDKAIPLPKELEHLMIHTQGCKSKAFKPDDIEILKFYLNEEGFKPGKSGNPNNQLSTKNAVGNKKPC